MNLDDERKPGGNPHESEADAKLEGIATEDDLLSDVVFDLIPEEAVDDEPSDDVFARDTAIPASPPEQLAAEAMRRAAADEQATAPRGSPDKPRAAPPPRRRRHTPVTMEPPPEDVEYESFEMPIDVFGHALPGTREALISRKDTRGFIAESEVPTAPPGLREPAPRTIPDGARSGRAAFLAETARNRPLDPALLARAERYEKNAGADARPFDDDASEGLEFLEGLGAGEGATDRGSPPPPPSSATRPSAKELEDSYARGDYNKALQIAEDLLARSPDDLSARRYAQNCRDLLTQMLTARIGPLDQVITVTVSPQEVQWLSLDHRAGFLLSLVDGQSTVDEILDISGMTRLDALRIIHDLAEQQVVRLA